MTREGGVCRVVLLAGVAAFAFPTLASAQDINARLRDLEQRILELTRELAEVREAAEAARAAQADSEAAEQQQTVSTQIEDLKRSAGAHSPMSRSSARRTHA